MILFLICSFVHLIVLSIVHQFSGSVVFQRYDHYLRPVENPDRKDTVSQAPAYKHRSSVFRVGAACIFRKEPLIRRDEPSSYKWKPELAAMGVAGKNQIHRILCVPVKQLRSVG